MLDKPGIWKCKTRIGDGKWLEFTVEVLGKDFFAVYDSEESKLETVDEFMSRIKKEWTEYKFEIVSSMEEFLLMNNHLDKHGDKRDILKK